MMGMASKFSPPPGASSGSGKGWIKKATARTWTWINKIYIEKETDLDQQRQSATSEWVKLLLNFSCSLPKSQ